MRAMFILSSILMLAFVGIVAFFWPPILWLLLGIVPLIGIGIYDMLQCTHAVLRNFPIIGHFRYLFEAIRPEINQYFIESNTDGVPYSREKRSVIYQRAKTELDTVPFGTQHDVYRLGYEWLNHSLAPKPVLHDPPRILIGEETCDKPYSASLLNISAMSFGSLSKNAILALNEGARRGGFAHNTGEGGLSPYHLEPGGDLIWQIGTGYFGCRKPDGGFDAEAFAERARLPQVKMIEVKLSQGAKPGHGGILPKEKLTEEIAKIRLVPLGKDVLSPPHHSAFDTPKGLLDFVTRLRELAGGKPVGFKLCLGSRCEFLSILKGMLETGQHPDFITVDGAEGGTGAAPLEFSNSIGTPLGDGLAFVHNALVGCGLRRKLKILAAGKISTGFHMAAKLALGADACNQARAMMFALGCIQALRCNSNTCPTGVATQDPALVAGLVVGDKAARVCHYHRITVRSLLELVSAAGLEQPSELRPWHVYRRVTQTEVKHLGQVYPMIEEGSILGPEPPKGFARPWHDADADRFVRGRTAEPV
ncbi:MAG: FMN-binding glutamate synthase family protein [Planctomycetota bacterium]